MDAEHRFIVALALICGSLVCVVAIILFAALWNYGQIIGLILVSLVSLLVLLLIGVTINEQILRHRRVKHQTELPLDSQGRPLYMPENMKAFVREEPRYD